MIPPAFMTIRIARINGRSFSLWLPAILLWPVILLMMMLVLPLVIVAEIFLRLTGTRFSIMMFCIYVYKLVCDLRGLLVDVKTKSGTADTVQVRVI